MPTFYYGPEGKLVRDKIPGFHEGPGYSCTLSRLSGVALSAAILGKIPEEAAEAADEITNPDAACERKIEELSDLQQLLDDVAVNEGISPEEIATAQAAKFAKKGGFLEGAYITSVTIPEDDSMVAYYRAEPTRYPEEPTLRQDAEDIAKQPHLELGRYRHYKGGEYEVLMLACDEKTLEWKVIYKPLYEHDGPDFWVRAYDVFTEEILVDGKKVKRFSKL